MSNDAEVVQLGGHTARKTFWIALLSGFIFFGGLLTYFGMSGTIFAAAIGGMGEFNVKFDRMEGTDFKLLGGLADTAEKKNGAVVATNKIKDVKIQGLVITKDIPAMGVRVVVKSDPKQTVEIKGLIQKATQIDGDARFEKLTMQENYVGDIKDPQEKIAEEFTQVAPKIILTDATLKTLYLYQDSLTLPGMKVYFEKL